MPIVLLRETSHSYTQICALYVGRVGDHHVVLAAERLDQAHALRGLLAEQALAKVLALRLTLELLAQLAQQVGLPALPLFVAVLKQGLVPLFGGSSLLGDLVHGPLGAEQRAKLAHVLQTLPDAG